METPGGKWYIANDQGLRLSTSSLKPEAAGTSQAWTIMRSGPGKFWFSTPDSQQLTDVFGTLQLSADKLDWQEWTVKSASGLGPCIDTSLVCSSEGDPHVHMWDGTKTNPMGVGEYILAKSTDGQFAVHACHTPVGDPKNGISANKGFAIKTPHGVVHVDASGYQIPDGFGSQNVGREISLSGGEVISASGNAISLSLPMSKYSGKLEGLCGHHGNAATAFINAQGQVIAHMPVAWGGPMGGNYQSDFADSFKVAPNSPDALFTAEFCPSLETIEPIPLEPFQQCPDLKAVAEADCPPGQFYHSCIDDVGMTCDTKYIVNAQEAQADLTAVSLDCLVDNQDIHGHDISLQENVQSAAACQLLCKGTDQCTHFSWAKEHTPDYGKCWLKNSGEDAFSWDARVSGPKKC